MLKVTSDMGSFVVIRIVRQGGRCRFLVCECLVNASVKYDESVWMKVRGGRGSWPTSINFGCMVAKADYLG